jgi:hypothetical protein
MHVSVLDFMLPPFFGLPELNAHWVLAQFVREASPLELQGRECDNDAPIALAMQPQSRWAWNGLEEQLSR